MSEITRVSGSARRVLSGSIVAAGVCLLASNAMASTYNGNGGTGFGGTVGNGSLTVTDAGAGALAFTFTPSGTFNGNDLVLYLDTKAGGVNDNSTLTDTADGGRTAISGLNGSGHALVTFAPGFGADYAISLEPTFAGIFNLSTPSNFGFVGSGGLSGSGTGPFTFSVNRSDIGLGPTAGFSFEGTFISTSAYRSNETIGTSATVPGSVGDTPNAGFGGTQTFATANTFAATPEPTGLAAIGATMALGLLRRGRRSIA